MIKIPLLEMQKKSAIDMALLSYITAIEGKKVDNKIISRREAIKRFIIDVYGEEDEDKLSTLSVTAQRLVIWRNTL